ncbi:MAG: hypothetical protein Q9181_007995 [Wetmoreana brouardii]
MLSKQTRALTALRYDLDDKDKAHSSETLCAVMALAEPSRGGQISHSEGAARILKARGLSHPRDDFEDILLLTLRGPVVVEALTNENINFTRQEWKLLVADGFERMGPGGKWVQCLAHVPDLMQRSKHTMRQSPTSALTYRNLKYEADSLRESCEANIETMRGRLMAFDEAVAPAGMASHLHANHLRSLSLALATGIVLDCILGALVGNSMPLLEQMSRWSKEIVQLAEVAVKYRPLGSMAEIIPLSVASIAAMDRDTKQKAWLLLEDYETVCLGKTTSNADAGLGCLVERLTLEGTRVTV